MSGEEGRKEGGRLQACLIADLATAALVSVPRTGCIFDSRSFFLVLIFMVLNGKKYFSVRPNGFVNASL